MSTALRAPGSVTRLGRVDSGKTALPVPECWVLIGSGAGTHQTNWELPQPLHAPGPPLLAPACAQVDAVIGLKGKRGGCSGVMLQTFRLDWALAAVPSVGKVRGQLAGLAVQEQEE